MLKSKNKCVTVREITQSTTAGVSFKWHQLHLSSLTSQVLTTHDKLFVSLVKHGVHLFYRSHFSFLNMSAQKILTSSLQFFWNTTFLDTLCCFCMLFKLMFVLQLTGEQWTAWQDEIKSRYLFGRFYFH